MPFMLITNHQQTCISWKCKVKVCTHRKIFNEKHDKDKLQTCLILWDGRKSVWGWKPKLFRNFLFWSRFFFHSCDFHHNLNWQSNRLTDIVDKTDQRTCEIYFFYFSDPVSRNTF